MARVSLICSQTQYTNKRFLVLFPLEGNVCSATACVLKMAEVDVAKIF